MWIPLSLFRARLSRLERRYAQAAQEKDQQLDELQEDLLVAKAELRVLKQENKLLAEVTARNLARVEAETKAAIRSGVEAT
jgi:hypothetical protein